MSRHTLQETRELLAGIQCFPAGENYICGNIYWIKLHATSFAHRGSTPHQLRSPAGEGHRRAGIEARNVAWDVQQVASSGR
jgi:hypothetical protein